jgi:hypothetical protein
MNAQQNKTALANYAGSKIGARIFNFGDGSDSDKVITPIYDQCRRFLLEECPWSFGIKTVTMTELNIASTVPEFNWGDGASIAYALPADFLKLYQVNFSYALIRFENIPGNGLVMLSDTAGLFMKYIFDNDDPTTYSAKFYEALACKIAKEACFKLVEAEKYAEAMKAEYESAFLTAAASDGQLSSPDQIDDSEWDFSRLAGSSGYVWYPSGTVGFYPTYPNT